MPDDDLRNLAQVLKDSFVQVNYDIEDNTPDCKFSGTTCSIVLTRGPQLISANAGDSRAIIVDKDGRARALSRDHKPDTPEEHQRIIARGGRVRPLINQQAGVEMGPARVWLKELEVPGLAMSRSLGDQVAQSVGVSPEPEITIYDIDINDRFIIIASDGVWEFLSNDQVAQMAIPFYAAGHAE
jgi:serine/threonine protein phosphatase PrpC